MSVNRVIILAAGQGFQLDGMNKALIRHPATGKTILDYAMDAFSGYDITVVVGFRAIQIMEAYPDLDFVINQEWALTSNAMSLGLALSDEPCYVVSGDIFFTNDLVRRLEAGPPDLVLTDNRENRTLTAIHCIVDDDDRVTETYQGPVRDNGHPEAVGMFKISDKTTLREWRKHCIRHGNLFVGQTLPCGHAVIESFPLENQMFDEINSSPDYLRLLQVKLTGS